MNDQEKKSCCAPRPPASGCGCATTAKSSAPAVERGCCCGDSCDCGELCPCPGGCGCKS